MPKRKKTDGDGKPLGKKARHEQREQAKEVEQAEEHEEAKVRGKEDDIDGCGSEIRDWTTHISRSGHPYYVHDRYPELRQWTKPPEHSLIAQHYDGQAKTASARSSEEEDPIVAQVRYYNNWVKATMLMFAASMRPGDQRFTRIIEWAGGRGGSMGQCMRLPDVTFYGLVDISADSVHEAATTRRDRYMRGSFADSQFVVADLLDGQKDGWKSKADICTLFFAVNYFAEAPKTLRTLMKRISASMEPGSSLLITYADVPHDDVEADEYNDAYSIKHRVDGSYTFTLKGCVDECPEYHVTADDLEAACAPYGLFPDGPAIRLDAIPPNALQRKMRVPEPMSKEALEICRCYSSHVFRKI